MTVFDIGLLVLLDLVIFGVTFVAVGCRLALRREPDFVIGRAGSAYMNRWWVIPRNRWFNIYLHQILRSDDDRALHDHPWFNVSVVLKGGYLEIMPECRPSPSMPVPPERRAWRGAGSIVFRRPTAAHRLAVLFNRPCWSLFITGPNVRDWGFWCPRGWKKWTTFVDMTNTGAIGPGCGEAAPGGSGDARAEP